MHKVFLLLFLLLGLNSFSQKKSIDTTTYDQWPGIGGPAISDDGRFVKYVLENSPRGENTLSISSTHTKWSLSVPGVTSADFANQGKYLIILKGNTLTILSLRDNRINRKIENVVSYNLCATENNQIISYRLLNCQTTIVLNIATGQHKQFENIEYSRFIGNTSKVFLFNGRDKLTSKYGFTVFDFNRQETKTITTEFIPEDLIYSADGQHVSFLQRRKTDIEIWSHQISKNLSSKIITCPNKDGEIELSRFSADGKTIFFYRKANNFIKTSPYGANVHVSSYNDITPRLAVGGEQSFKFFLVSVNIKTKKINQLQKQNEDVNLPYVAQNNDEWLLGKFKEASPNVNLKPGSFVISPASGKKIKLPNDWLWINFSPDGKFLLFINSTNNKVCSYNLSTKRILALSGEVGFEWMKRDDDDADVFAKVNYRGIAGWIGSNVLLYDGFDIWSFDVTGRQRGYNLTNSYGRRNKIIFQVVSELPKNEKSSNKLILSAFDCVTKKNGFFSVQLKESNNPSEIRMDASLYWNPSAGIHETEGLKPLKAKNKNVFLVQSMSARSHPNYFVTESFQKLRKISNVHPEKKINWLNTELHSWKNLEGKELQGILYKPEDFDSTKKYPVIFYYYRKLSGNLNAFPEPKCEPCTINIATYVSNGYLVFTPDIFFTVGKTGESALSAVATAADHLSKLSFVNSKKIGLNGCSFSGFTTNYIITHSDIFASAVSSSGLFDLVSAYNSFNGGIIKQNQLETGPYQIGGSMWEFPERYIDNSPIFRANKVTTPLLIAHTISDYTIPHANAVEFFLAMRRLGKACWFLEYEDEIGHGVSGKQKIDFNIRVQQFFDYFLKDKTMPDWMKQKS